MDSRIAALFALAATACQSAAPAAEKGAAASLYQYAGSKQCERGGKSLDALRRELAGAGVQVHSAACGSDGRMYAQSCGMPDGRILVVEVAQSQAAAATRVGLKPLRELPEAVTAPCR
jgi:hypothetical protein